MEKKIVGTSHKNNKFMQGKGFERQFSHKNIKKVYKEPYWLYVQ